jgi:hypothetical protein
MNYTYSSIFFIGEVMNVEGEYIDVMLYPDRYANVRLASPIYISSEECGLITFSISNVTRAKYGKEFALIKRDTGIKTPNVYPDIRTHYNYIIRVYNLYYIDRDGNIIRRMGCNPSPHDPAYSLSKEDLRKILFTPSFNGDILRILSMVNPNPLFIREFLTCVKGVYDEYDLSNLLTEMLSALHQAGYRMIHLFLRDFKEVFLGEG